MGARVTVIAVPHALFILVQALVGAPALDIHGICFSGAILKRCDVQIIVFVGNPAGVAPSVLVRIAPYKVHVRKLFGQCCNDGDGTTPRCGEDNRAPCQVAAVIAAIPFRSPVLIAPLIPCHCIIVAFVTDTAPPQLIERLPVLGLHKRRKRIRGCGRYPIALIVKSLITPQTSKSLSRK